MAAGAALAELPPPPGVAAQPELAAAALARLAEDDALRERRGREARAAAETQQSPRDRAGARRPLSQPRRAPARAASRRLDSLAGRLWLVAIDMHTSWSHDCSIEVDELLDHAEAEGLGAIAVTDHNVFGGARGGRKRAGAT